MAKKKEKEKFSFINELHEEILEIATVARDGSVRIKRTDLRKAMETVLEKGAKSAAGGDRIRLPFIGSLSFKEVKARKAGKGTNPFTGEPMTIKARPATKKPRFTFSKGAKETFANKRNW